MLEIVMVQKSAILQFKGMSMKYRMLGCPLKEKFELALRLPMCNSNIVICGRSQTVLGNTSVPQRSIIHSLHWHTTIEQFVNTPATW